MGWLATYCGQRVLHTFEESNQYVARLVHAHPLTPTVDL